MKTSYFSCYKGNKGVSIARFMPKGMWHRTYPDLAPTSKLLTDYKAGLINEAKYTQIYNEKLLQLDPLRVYHQLGHDAVLLCWEKPEKFCHRHLVAKWLSKNLRIEVEELDG